MTPESVLLALIAALLVAALVVFFRVTNSRGTISWDLRVVEPDANLPERAAKALHGVEKIREERDEARRAAEQLRAELERLSP